MRIGLDARMYRSTTGGIGTYSRQLIKYLAQLDPKNQYFVFLTKEDLKEYNIKAKNFKPVETDIPHYSIEEQLRLPGILNKYRLDLVHFLHFTHPIFYSGRFVISIHDLTMGKSPIKNLSSFIRKPLYNIVMRDAVQRSSLISALSQETEKDLIKDYSVKPEKIRIIPLAAGQRFRPVSIKESQPILNKYGLKRPYFLYAGQWRPHKGIDYLIKGMRLFRQRFGQPEVKLVIVGQPADKFPWLAKEIKKAVKEKMAMAPGFIDEQDLPAIYSQAELFVFPSLYEGFGLPPLEAMACGTPVASSNFSCLPEVLGNAPLYFDPMDPADIALKLNILLTNRKLADRLIRRGLAQIKKYSWEKTGQKTLELYQEACCHGKPR